MIRKLISREARFNGGSWNFEGNKLFDSFGVVNSGTQLIITLNNSFTISDHPSTIFYFLQQQPLDFLADTTCNSIGNEDR